MRHTIKVMTAEGLRVATKKGCAEQQQMFATNRARYAEHMIAEYYAVHMNPWPVTTRTVPHMFATPAETGDCVSRISTSTAPCMRMQRLKGDDLTAARVSV